MYWNLYRRYCKWAQNEGNYERGCTFKHFRVPTPLSTWQSAPLPKYTESGSSKQAAQLSPRAALHALCFTSTYLSKYVSFSCKSMCIDIYRRQLRWSSPSVNWSVIRMQFFLQAQSSVCKPSDWACKHLIEWSAAVFAGHGASSNDCSVIQLGRVLSQIRPSCIRNHQNIQFWMTVRSLLGYFRPELSVKASLLGKVIRQGLENGTEVFKYCTSYYH